METLKKIKKGAKHLAGVLIIVLTLESGGLFVNNAMGEIIEITDEEMGTFFSIVDISEFLNLNRYDFGCDFDGDFDCWQRIMFFVQDLGDFIPHPERPIKYNLIIRTERDTGKLIIAPKKIRRGSITHFYNTEKRRYERVWNE